MDEEIEDLVGDVRFTDSQKSVTTSNAYSPDFTDSCSDKNHSSGKDTYVIDWDDSEDSDKSYPIRRNPSIINLINKIEELPQTKNVAIEPTSTINRSACTSFQNCSIVSQEIYTQTSKTIFELVSKETDFNIMKNSTTLQTQTSFLSVTENKTISRKIEVTGVIESCSNNALIQNLSENDQNLFADKEIHQSANKANSSQGDSSTKYPESETQNEITGDADSESTFSDRIIQFTDAESDENLLIKDQDKYEYNCDHESSKFDSDIEEDSLMIYEYSHDKTDKLDSISDTSVPKSIDNDVEELYNKISESIDLMHAEKPIESNLRRLGTLTPLTEEFMPKKDSIIDVTPCISIPNAVEEEKFKTFFISKPGTRSTMSANKSTDENKFKLPLIHKNKSCPNSPNLNFLFSINTQSQGVGQKVEETFLNRWDLCTKKLAGGESPLISGRSDSVRNPKETFHLPPINVEGAVQNSAHKVFYFSTSRLDESPKDSININDKIKELKISERKNRLLKDKHETHTSRGGSPASTDSPEPRLCDVAERGSDALCTELLRRLRSSSWTEAADTLKEIPQALNKFWDVLSENKIADLLRQVTVHVESPRTQLARLACNTIAEILKNTNYTKKPDFYEAMSSLLTKTGSLCRPVRRAANVALDDIVSGAELSHALTALCVHGVGHKSALVRCAAARLMVVCCALAEGGRSLLRSRPPSAAAARRHALRALAALLDDKNGETRKYAERLYTMLRPLTNFEAYFLTDVDVELAARLMKKLDKILIRTPTTR